MACSRADCFGGANCVAGAALWQPEVKTFWQAQDFRKVKYGFLDKRSTFARLSADFVAGAALSQGQVLVDTQIGR